MTELEFKNGELKNLNGGYLFYGGEDYLKYQYSKLVQKNVLDGMFDEFNHIVIYAEDFSPATLSNAIFTLPMMSDKKLVEVRGVDFKAMKKDEISALEEVLATLGENSHTVLLIRADNDCFDPGKNAKSPSEMLKMMSKYVKPVGFEFPTAARLRDWIVRSFGQGKVSFDPALCEYLVSMCGHDMWTLSKEIDKLCSYAAQNGLEKIEAKDIDYICCKTIEFDDYQLTNALLDRNKALVFETLRRQRSAHEPPQAILGSVIRLYSDMLLVYRLYASGMNKGQISQALGMHEFKVGKYISSMAGTSEKKLCRAVELCKEADVKSKSSSNVTLYIAVERLLCALCALFCR